MTNKLMAIYVNRTLENTILQVSQDFPVVAITGPRQVGKTTVFENCENRKRTYVSLDNMSDRNLAKNDPELFLERYTPPVLIDEIQ